MRYLKKLKHRSFREFFYRLKIESVKQKDKIRLLIKDEYLTDHEFLKNLNFPYSLIDDNQIKILDYLRNQKKNKFFIDLNKKDEYISIYKKYFQRQIRSSILKADEICNNRLNFFGKEITYDKEIFWNRDPISGKLWPKEYFSSIKIYNENSSIDIKYVWELNRCQFLIDLGKAYFLTNNEKYSKKIIDIIESWIDDNPYLIGVNWTSALEVAIRSISWIWAYHFCLESKNLSLSFLKKFLKILYLNAKYIDKHLSIYSSPYNHLIGELTALYFISVSFPEFDCSARWEPRSWSLLKENITKQFHKDGGSVEQATFYHHFTLGFFIMVALLRQKNNRQVPGFFWKTIENALNFSMYIIKPDKTIPKIGDVDNAQSIYFGRPHSWDFTNFLSLGAGIFNRGDMKNIAAEQKEEILWLQGPEKFHSYQKIKQEIPKQTSIFFKDSGYFIMRSGWGQDANYLCFDCGDQCSGLFTDDTPSAGHGHADCLSIIVSCLGKNFIIDPAVYTYCGPYKLEAYFRSTAAHNSIILNGQNQATYLGEMTWCHTFLPKIEKIIIKKDFDYVQAFHNGFQKLKNAAIHKRIIFFKKPEYWIIYDRVEGKGNYPLEAFFHFDVEKENIILEKNRGVIYTNDTKNVLLEFLPDMNICLHNGGQEGPIGGWKSQGYGMKEAGAVLTCCNKKDRPYWQMATIIYPFKKNPPQINLLDIYDGMISFSIKTNKVEDLIVINYHNKNIRYKEINTNVNLVCHRIDKKQINNKMIKI